MKLLTKFGLIGVLAVAGAGALFAMPGAGASAASPEMIGRAQEMHNQMVGDAQHVQHLQQIARKEKDVIKLNCVNDKLVQMRPLLNMADRAQASVMSGGDSAGLQEMGTAATEIRRLRETADQCIGEPTLGTESSNSYTHPPINDPTGTNPFGPTFEPPGYASPIN